MEIFNDNRLSFQLRHPFSFSLIGPSQSGKTTFVLDLIERHEEIVSVKFDRIIYIYTEDQPLYDEFKKKHPNVIFTKDMEFVTEIRYSEEKTLIVFDDKILDFIGKENEVITDFCVKGSHHRNISVIILLQNAFAKNLRTCSINSTYACFFLNPRDRGSISTLSKQIYPGKPGFLADAYEKAVSRAFGYLMFDFHMLTNNKYRVRNSLYPTRECEVYIPATDGKDFIQK